MIFDPLTRRKLSDYGGRERVFLLHSAYARTPGEARQKVREHAKTLGLLEEDLSVSVAVLAPGLLRTRHVLLDLHEGSMAVAEAFSVEVSEDGLGFLDVEAIEFYPYVCLLSELAGFLADGAPRFVIDTTPEATSGFVVVTYMGPKGIFTAALTGRDEEALLREVSFEGVTAEDLSQAQRVRVSSPEEYVLHPARFFAYQDFVRDATSLRVLAGLSCAFLVLAGVFAFEGLNAVHQMERLRAANEKLAAEVRILEARVRRLPKVDPAVKQAFVHSERLEALLTKLPPYVRIVDRPPEAVRPFLRRYRGRPFLLVDVGTFPVWLKLKRLLPDAELVTGTLVVIPLS